MGFLFAAYTPADEAALRLRSRSMNEGGIGGLGGPARLELTASPGCGVKEVLPPTLSTRRQILSVRETASAKEWTGYSVLTNSAMRSMAISIWSMAVA